MLLFQGSVEMYGTIAELTAQNIDHRLLFGLIGKESEDGVEENGYNKGKGRRQHNCFND